MKTIQWRPEVNALTTPHSYRILHLPHGTANRADIAADIALRQPNLTQEMILTVLRIEDEVIQARLINGEQVTKEGSFSWFLSFTGRLNSPDDPLPPLDECLQINMRVSPPFAAVVRQAAQTERLPMEKRLPLISTAQDSLLKLNDVLSPAGALQLTGDDLFFDPADSGSECVLAGTRNGRIVQTRLIKVETSEIIFMPDIPEQDAPWNNEYTVSVSTRYSEHGTLRTGTYARMLRTPLLWDGAAHEGGTGMLTGEAEVPYVTISSGTDVSDGLFRVQAVYDAHTNALLLSLLEMKEGDGAGASVPVTANGAFTLPGFSGAPVGSLIIAVEQYSDLKALVRNKYGGRLIDIVSIAMT